MTQVKIYDIENNAILGGILTDNGSVICACCEGLITEDEIIYELEAYKNNYEVEDDIEAGLEAALDDGYTHIIVETYSNWIDLSQEICGDDIYAEGIEDYLG